MGNSDKFEKDRMSRDEYLKFVERYHSLPLAIDGLKRNEMGSINEFLEKAGLELYLEDFPERLIQIRNKIPIHHRETEQITLVEVISYFFPHYVCYHYLPQGAIDRLKRGVGSRFPNIREMMEENKDNLYVASTIPGVYVEVGSFSDRERRGGEPEIREVGLKRGINSLAEAAATQEFGPFGEIGTPSERKEREMEYKMSMLRFLGG